MSFVRTAIRTAPAVVAAALVAGAARPAAAQERTLFSWQGRVDREASLVMRDGRVVAPGGWSGGSRGDLRVDSELPETEGVVRVRVDRGRGAVEVVEQPTSRNDYRAIVRIRDDQSGADDYRITAYWQPAYGSVASGRGRGGWDDDRDDRARDRDDRYDRARDREERRREREARRRERDERRDRDGRRGNDDGRYGDYGRTGNGGYGSSSGTLRWSGRVDAVEEIRIRGRRVDSYTVSGAGASGVRSRVDGSLGGPAYVRVRRADGRGQVQVVQQPSASNDYTAVLRIVDRQGGAGHYDVEASW